MNPGVVTQNHQTAQAQKRQKQPLRLQNRMVKTVTHLTRGESLVPKEGDSDGEDLIPETEGDEATDSEDGGGESLVPDSEGEDLIPNEDQESLLPDDGDSLLPDDAGESGDSLLPDDGNSLLPDLPDGDLLPPEDTSSPPSDSLVGSPGSTTQSSVEDSARRRK